MKIIRKLFRLHHWRYRNPFDRTCRVCGRHEVQHTYEPIVSKRLGWWETFDEGDVNAKPCGESE